MSTMPYTQSASYDDTEGEVWGRLLPGGSGKRMEKYGVIELIDQQYTFGRDKNKCMEIIDEPQISGLHCVLRTHLTGGDKIIVTIVDRSTNGTYINNHKIGKGNTRNLADGDELIFIQESKRDKRTNLPREKISYMFYMSKRTEKPNTLEAKYDLRKELGSGSFADVRLGIDRNTGNKYAIKSIDKNKYAIKSKTRAPETIKNEIDILKKLDHKNIIKVYDTYETKTHLHIVLEMAKGGELFHRILEKKKLPENICRYVMRQLLNAINYLHQNKIAHRDLKPENILMVYPDKNKWDIKLTDFGLSKALGMSNEVLTTICGTPLFLAPEVLHSKKTKCGYTFSVDYWSIGVILYLMLVGHPPYNEKDGNLLSLVKGHQFTFPEKTWSKVSLGAKDLVQRLMEVNPNIRLNYQQAKNHSWMRDKPINPQNCKSHPQYWQKNKMSVSKKLTDVKMIDNRKRKRNIYENEINESKNNINDNDTNMILSHPLSKRRRLNNTISNNNTIIAGQLNTIGMNKYNLNKINTKHMSIDNIGGETQIGVPLEDINEILSGASTNNSSQPGSQPLTPLDSQIWKNDSAIMTDKYKKKQKLNNEINNKNQREMSID